MISWNNDTAHYSSSAKNAKVKDKRSRSFKRKRQLYNSIGRNQTRIPSYFKIVDEIQKILNKNKELQNIVQNLLNPVLVTKETGNSYEVLNLLVKTAKDNKKAKQKEGYRYDDVIKKFSTYIFMLGGRLCYETLQKNIGLPAPSSISRYLKANGPVVAEGVLRCEELKTYLVDNNLPLFVWLSEDATRITGRIQYDSNTNQLIGFVLPFDKNGMPITNVYMARSAQEIEKHFKNNSTIASQVMNKTNIFFLYTFIEIFFFKGICSYGSTIKGKFSCILSSIVWNRQ